jgi:CRISPR-associated exonuclease Cas4
MYSEDDLLPISGLQHLRFCERRWSLVHLEQQWEENRLTAEGGALHERVRGGGIEARPGVVIARGLHLRSLWLGVSGVAVVVEFHPDPVGITLTGREGTWRPFPVEYKRGQRKWESSHMVQLCAQAMCLEEMLSVEVPDGAVFHGVTRRRTKVVFDLRLRAQTEALARRMHELSRVGMTPAAVYSKKCESCSLYHRCLPRMGPKRNVERYVARALKECSGKRWRRG